MVYRVKTKNKQAPYSTTTIAVFYLNLIDRFAIALLGKSTLDDIFWLIAHNTKADLEFEDCVIYLVAENDTTYTRKQPRVLRIQLEN
ncbi:MAG: hypothetical protein VX709_04325 [Pseudomonadota bacterium]|nr:hypothetical protein [Pseudomonadota bacterium]MEC8820075.1 hypothetical protein [Pseudomonadota bacterium]